jgi:hypothetical protein
MGSFLPTVNFNLPIAVLIQSRYPEPAIIRSKNGTPETFFQRSIPINGISASSHGYFDEMAAAGAGIAAPAVVLSAFDCRLFIRSAIPPVIVCTALT